MSKKKEFQYEVSVEELNRLVYRGTLEIPEEILEEIKDRYYRLISRLIEINRPHFHFIPEDYIIDLDELIRCLDEYYTESENPEVNYTKRTRHIQLFRRFGIPTLSELKEGIIPDLPENKEESGTTYGSLNTAINDIIKKYLRKFLVSDIRYTERGLEIIELSDISIRVLTDCNNMSRIKIPIRSERTTIGELKSQIEASDDIKRKRGQPYIEYRDSLSKYLENREDVIRRFDGLIVRSDCSTETQKAKMQLSELQVLTKGVTINTARNEQDMQSVINGQDSQIEGIGEFDE